jgi:hypothetical protein
MASRACHRYDREVASGIWWKVTLGGMLACGCSPASPSAHPTTSIPPAEAPGRSDGPALPTLVVEPTGVPGLAATDPFCATWASYVGTLQVLGTAAAFGDLTSGDLASLELTAAPRLVDDAAAIDTSWPAELATERAIAVEQRIGPYARRAQRGVQALIEAGVGTDELIMLSDAWEAALLARDPVAPVIEIPPVADGLRAKVDRAGQAYDAAFTPFSQDPSLVVEGLATPLTDAYLSAHCPDLAASGVGDAL